MVQRGKIVAEATPADLVARYGGDATVSIVADGFIPNHALENLGTSITGETIEEVED
jgi:hypothetical protein